MAGVKGMRRVLWNARDVAILKRLYPDQRAADVAARLGRPLGQIHRKAAKLGLKKSAAFLVSDLSGRTQRGRIDPRMVATQFKPGNPPPNKGLRRPGWYSGRMRETQFKKGQFPANKDPEFYVLGALRVNTYGYIDMRVSFEPGAKGWKALHRILWEDAHGPVPKGCCLRFIDGDKLNVCLENIECISRADNARRNSIHRLPPDLKAVIHLKGQLKRRIRESHDKRSARHAV